MEATGVVLKEGIRVQIQSKLVLVFCLLWRCREILALILHVL